MMRFFWICAHGGSLSCVAQFGFHQLVCWVSDLIIHLNQIWQAILRGVRPTLLHLFRSSMAKIAWDDNMASGYLAWTKVFSGHFKGQFICRLLRPGYRWCLHRLLDIVLALFLDFSCCLLRRFVGSILHWFHDFPVQPHEDVTLSR